MIGEFELESIDIDNQMKFLRSQMHKDFRFANLALSLSYSPIRN
jgi:hypothetical protein